MGGEEEPPRAGAEVASRRGEAEALSDGRWMTEGVYYLKIQLQKASGSRYYFLYPINILIKKKKVLRIKIF